MILKNFQRFKNTKTDKIIGGVEPEEEMEKAL